MHEQVFPKATKENDVEKHDHPRPKGTWQERERERETNANIYKTFEV